MCTCGLRMVVWMGLLFLESTDVKGRLWNLVATQNRFSICLFSTYSCQSKSDGSPFPPPDYPAPPARRRSSRDHRSCCEHTEKGQKVQSAIARCCSQDFTGARGRKSYQNMAPIPNLATAAESYDTERNPGFHRGQKVNSLLFII